MLQGLRRHWNYRRSNQYIYKIANWSLHRSKYSCNCERRCDWLANYKRSRFQSRYHFQGKMRINEVCHILNSLWWKNRSCWRRTVTTTPVGRYVSGKVTYYRQLLNLKTFSNRLTAIHSIAHGSLNGISNYANSTLIKHVSIQISY